MDYLFLFCVFVFCVLCFSFCICEMEWKRDSREDRGGGVKGEERGQSLEFGERLDFFFFIYFFLTLG